MTATTTRLTLPYPQGTDPNNYPGQMQALAQAIDPIAVEFSQGTFAARPVAAVQGRVYCATDTGNVYWDTGTAWIALNVNTAATVTTKGDLLVASASGALARLGVGTDGQSLTAASGATNGVQWQSILGLPLALTGATTATRWVGGTTSGAPASGTFALGDFVITQAGRIWICTSAGSPGTWTQVGTTNPTFRRVQGTSQPFTSSTSLASVVFDVAATEDTDGGWGASTTTYTFVTPGLWVLGYSACVAASGTTTGGLTTALVRNGTAIPGSGDTEPFVGGTTGEYFTGKSVPVRVAAGDTLTLGLLQNSGVPRSTQVPGTLGEGCALWGYLIHG